MASKVFSWVSFLFALPVTTLANPQFGYNESPMLAAGAVAAQNAAIQQQAVIAQTANMAAAANAVAQTAVVNNNMAFAAQASAEFGGMGGFMFDLNLPYEFQPIGFANGLVQFQNQRIFGQMPMMTILPYVNNYFRTSGLWTGNGDCCSIGNLFTGVFNCQVPWPTQKCFYLTCTSLQPNPIFSISAAMPTGTFFQNTPFFQLNTPYELQPIGYLNGMVQYQNQRILGYTAMMEMLPFFNNFLRTNGLWTGVGDCCSIGNVATGIFNCQLQWPTQQCFYLTCSSLQPNPFFSFGMTRPTGTFLANTPIVPTLPGGTAVVVKK